MTASNFARMPVASDCAWLNTGAKHSNSEAAAIANTLFTAFTSDLFAAARQPAMSGERDACKFALTHLVYMRAARFDFEIAVFHSLAVDLDRALLDHSKRF